MILHRQMVLNVSLFPRLDLTNKKERMETLHQLISRLPAINHAVLERLIFHLARSVGQSLFTQSFFRSGQYNNDALTIPLKFV